MEQAKAAAQRAFMNHYSGCWKKEKCSNKDEGKLGRKVRFSGKENLPPPAYVTNVRRTREEELDREVQEAVEGIIQHMRYNNPPNKHRSALRTIL